MHAPKDSNTKVQTSGATYGLDDVSIAEKRKEWQASNHHLIKKLNGLLDGNEDNEKILKMYSFFAEVKEL